MRYLLKPLSEDCIGNSFFKGIKGGSCFGFEKSIISFFVTFFIIFGPCTSFLSATNYNLLSPTMIVFIYAVLTVYDFNYYTEILAVDSLDSGYEVAETVF